MPQEGIFKGEVINNFAHFQEFSFGDNTNIPQLKEAILSLYQMNSENLSVVIAFGKRALSELGSALPEGLIDFTEINGKEGLKMPATQTDILIWSHSSSKSEIFDFTLESEGKLNPLIITKQKEDGFLYKDSRDLLGFVDGSANPKGNEKRMKEALIPEGETHENGSFVLTQKWIHDIASFQSKKVDEQEKIIGRTKRDSIELEGDAMPSNSHVSRTDVKIDGEAMKIFRRSYPYANKEYHGLYFLSFAKEIKRFSIQLERMVGATEDGITDRIMEFSAPITGSYYFSPSKKELIKILTT